MAEKTEEHERTLQPVAVSSTSSLDSFAATIPLPTPHEDCQHSVPAPIIPSLSGRFSESAGHFVKVNNPLATPVANVSSPVDGPINTTTTAPIQGSTSHAAPAPANNTVAEFLYQLTKMLTEDNRQVIEWCNGKIEVHNPHKLASDVLHKYFRHSKFASFQRQLNYFGFRKLAGKGKMAPCSYVNDAATSDLRSLLLIKRKTTPATGREKSKKRERIVSNGELSATAATPSVNPVLANILHRETAVPDSKLVKFPKISSGKGIKHQLNGYLKKPAPASGSHQALAQTAVGKGIRHSYSATGSISSKESATSTSSFTFKDPHQLGMDVQSSLSELSNNYQNSLKDTKASESGLGMLSRNSSLVDLAMLDPIEPTPVSELKQTSDPNLMPFIDFPQPTLGPKSGS